MPVGHQNGHRPAEGPAGPQPEGPQTHADREGGRGRIAADTSASKSQRRWLICLSPNARYCLWEPTVLPWTITTLGGHANRVQH